MTAANYAGRHRAPTPAPVITADTAPNNPVNAYPADVFPLGAAITVAYGSTERMFCTLGNLYRLVGFLVGEVPSVEGQPERAADPDAVPPVEYQPFIPSLADEIARCRPHVVGELEGYGITPPPPGLDDGGDRMTWLTAAMVEHGDTVTLHKPELPGWYDIPRGGE